MHFVSTFCSMLISLTDMAHYEDRQETIKVVFMCKHVQYQYHISVLQEIKSLNLINQ